MRYLQQSTFLKDDSCGSLKYGDILNAPCHDMLSHFSDVRNRLQIEGNHKITLFQGRKTPEVIINQTGTRMAEIGHDWDGLQTTNLKHVGWFFQDAPSVIIRFRSFLCYRISHPHAKTVSIYVTCYQYGNQVRKLHQWHFINLTILDKNLNLSIKITK